MGIVSDMIEGFVILTMLCGIYGFTNDMIRKASEVQSHGIMSFGGYSIELTKP